MENEYVNLYFDDPSIDLPVKLEVTLPGVEVTLGLTAEQIHDASQWLKEQDV